MTKIAEVIIILAGVAFILFMAAWFTVLPMLGIFYICGWLK